MKFRFSLEIGILYRKEIRSNLLQAKDDFEYRFPGSELNVREEKNTFDSVFYIQGKNFPDTAEFEVKNWFNQFKQLATEN